MKKLNNKKGFTLIELIIVIAILAVLAVVAVPVVGGIIGDANESVDKTNLALFESTLERYLLTDTADGGGAGAYPADGTVLGTAIKNFTNLKTIPIPKSEKSKVFVYNKKTYEISIGVVGTDISEIK